MTLNQLSSTLRMLGWYPIGGGMLMPPESYKYHEAIMLTAEDEILIGNATAYTTNEEALNYILENTDD